MQSDSKTAVVVGAGPAGCLVACCLAQRGWQVTVVEQRDEKACTAASTHRAYPMGLNIRSCRAVQAAGIHVPSLESQKMEYVVLNGMASSISWPGATDSYLVDRIALNRELYEAARAQQYHGGGGITWQFGYTLKSVDFQAKQAVFASSAGAELRCEYQLLVGADGGRSAVRSALQQVEPGLTTTLLYQPTQTYKTFHGLCAAEGSSLHPSFATGLPGQYLYFNMYKGMSSGTFTRALL